MTNPSPGRTGAGRGGASRRAFTLIELVAAAAITAVLAGFIVTIVSNVSGFWNRTSGRLSTEAQARLVLDQLAVDLSSAVFREDGNTWMAATINNNATGVATGLWQTAGTNPKPNNTVSLDLPATRTGVTVRGAIAEARFGHAGVWLRFFTTRRGTNASAAASSAPVAVGYQIVRRFSGQSTLSTKTPYLLHRAEVRPAAAVVAGTTRNGVMESGYNILATAYTTSTAASNNGATTGDPRSIQVPGASRTNLASVIADNVIDFGVRCYVRDTTKPDGLRLVFPAADETGTPSNATTARLRAQLPATTVATSTNYDLVFPDVVEVMVRILTDEGARLIGEYERPGNQLTPPAGVNPQQYWWQIATANSQVYTRRIVINAKPL